MTAASQAVPASGLQKHNKLGFLALAVCVVRALANADWKRIEPGDSSEEASVSISEVSFRY